MLKVYGDESSDGTHQRVFAVSGILGSEEEWALTEQAWLASTRGEEFHAAEWEHAGRHVEFEQLVATLAGGYVVGIVVSLDIAAFRYVLPQPHDDFPYYRCLTEVIKRLSNQAKRFNANVLAGQYPRDEPVSLEFTFDDRKETKGNAGTLYQAFVKQPEWAADAEQFGEKIRWANRKNPRIQMADLLAREGMKDLDRILGGSLQPKRKAKLALEACDRFAFIQYDRAAIEDWWRQVQKIEREEGSPGDGYGKWLVDTGRVQHGKLHDNPGNRIAYFMWLDRKNNRK